MPLICEVCGNREEAAEANLSKDHLHVCSNCVKDREHPDVPEIPDMQ